MYSSKPSVFRIIRAFPILLALLSPAAVRAQAPAQAPARQGMPLDHSEYVVQPGAVKQDPIVAAAGLDKASKQTRAMANYASRVELEGKVDIPLDQIDTAVVEFRKLSKDQPQVEKLLGKGWRISEVGLWDVHDLYRDSKDYDLAKAGSSNRMRTQAGKSQINTKPPGGVHIDKAGLIAGRVENNFTGTQTTSVHKVAATQSRFNPFNWVRTLLNKDPASVTRPSVDILQKRSRFVLEREHTGPDGKAAWEPLVDISVDDVTATNARGPKANRQSTRFAQIEADLNHPGSGTGLVIADVKWTPPHQPSDLKRAALQKDEAVVALKKAVPALLNHIGVNYKPAASPNKYVEGATRLRLLPPSATASRDPMKSSRPAAPVRATKNSALPVRSTKSPAPGMSGRSR